MSQEVAQAFLTRVGEDKELRQQLQALGKGAGIADVLKLAQKHGFQFSYQDLIAASMEMVRQRPAFSDEIPDDDLEKTSGGVTLPSGQELDRLLGFLFTGV